MWIAVISGLVIYLIVKLFFYEDDTLLDLSSSHFSALFSVAQRYAGLFPFFVKNHQSQSILFEFFYGDFDFAQAGKALPWKQSLHWPTNPGRRFRFSPEYWSCSRHSRVIPLFPFFFGLIWFLDVNCFHVLRITIVLAWFYGRERNCMVMWIGWFCYRGAMVITVKNISGFVSTDKDGNWVCTDGKHHRTDVITNPVSCFLIIYCCLEFIAI